MLLSFLQQFRAARRAGAPLIAVRTPDPTATIMAISNDEFNKKAPIILWDAARGLVAVTKPSGEELARALLGRRCKSCGELSEPVLTDCGDHTETRAAIRCAKPNCKSTELEQVTDSVTLASPIDMLMRAAKMPSDAILFMSNMHRFIAGATADPVVIQALWNLRDSFKQNTRTLVILCPDVALPPELSQDTLTLDEPLPDAKKLELIVSDTYNAASLAAPKKEVVERAVDALCGLSAFTAEQVCSMSISKNGLDIDQLWERKRQQIEQTPGLSVYRGTEKFADVKGCDNLIEFVNDICNGEDAPSAIVFSDEIDKQFAGMGNDQDSVTKEMVGAWLTWCETKLSNGDPKVIGMILLGPAGTGKSMIAKAAGNEFGKPTIIQDLSAMKGSLVGQSQQNFNMSTKVIDAVSGDKPVLLITTCNRFEILPPEVQSRLSLGQFFVDLPNQDGRNLLWKQYMGNYGLTDKDRPKDLGWTGREIRNCCMLAKRTRKSLVDVSKFIVPVSVSKRELVESIRREADGRFTSANHGGLYKAPEGIEDVVPEVAVVAVGMVQPNKRKINTGGGGKGMN